MKNIISLIKSEIFYQHSSVDGLVKEVAVSQESYLKDRSDEGLFNAWSESVKKLQKVESNLRYLRSAYVTMCNACEVEPMTIDEIVKDKTEKAVKRAERKSATKDADKKDGEQK